MIEKIVLDFLSEGLAIPVSLEVPEKPQPLFIVLEKVGGRRQEHISFATLAVQSYGPSLYEAATLNERVKAVMNSLPELDEITRSQLNSDYNFTDTATKRYRYQAVYDIAYYE